MKNSLKYFNLFLGILMLVVLSLNIEQVFHNKHLVEIEISMNQTVDDLKCHNCQAQALNYINKLDSK